MLTMLRKVLKDFEITKQEASADQEFGLLYDSVLHISKSTQSNDNELANNIQTLLGYYELVARSNQTDVFIEPNSRANRFVFQLALMLSEKYKQPVYSILYARSLLWPENTGAWYDPIMGGNELPLEHGEFAITTSGDVCQLECLIDTAIRVFSKGHRDQQQIWQNNDPRRLNQPLPKNFIPTLCHSFPAFKQFHDHIRSVTADTPLSRLQALREGLRNGSAYSKVKEGKGEQFNAGTAANEAIAVFSLWWDDIGHVSYKQRTLREALSELKTGHHTNRNLGAFFAIILRDTSANVSATMEDATTCVQLRGDELQSAIALNIHFLSSFEKPGPGQQELLQYKSTICSSFNRYNQKKASPTQAVQNVLIITTEAHQLPYFAYTLTQLWRNFLSDNVSKTSIIELAALLEQMSVTQRQQFNEHPADFNTEEENKFKELRLMLRQLEIKLENNVLLPSHQKHPLSPVDHALLNILPFNLALLRWVTLRYEFIMFTNRSLCHLVLKQGVEIKLGRKTLTSYDFFSFVSYMHHKTKDASDRKQKRIQLLRHLLDIDNLAVLLNINTFDTIETNPLTPFCNELLQLAKNTGALSQPRTAELLTLMAQHPNFLTSSLDDDGNAFLHHAFAENNTPIIHWLVGLPDWEKLSQSLHQVKNWTLFDVIAITGHTEQYERLKNTHNKSDWPFAMTLAVKNKHDQFCELLLNDGVDPNGQYGDNDRLLIIAARKGYVTICRLLLKHGANPNVQCNKGYFEGYSALAFAAKRDKGEVCTLLIEHGANPGITNRDGQTAEQLWRTRNPLQKNNPFNLVYRAQSLETKRTKMIQDLTLKMPSAFWKKMGFFSNREVYERLLQRIQETAFKKTDSPNKTADDVLSETINTYLAEQHGIDDKTKMNLLAFASPSR